VTPATSTRVTGTVVGVGSTPHIAATSGLFAYLRHVVGRRWRNVTFTTIRSSGGYSFVVSPRRRGHHTYRVWFYSQPGFASAATRRFTITVR
jgi:hypothetical protein